MNAHKVIESLRKMGFSGKIPKLAADHMEHVLARAAKFEFDFGEFPVLDESDMLGVIERLRLPFEVCYFEVPGCGAVLMREASISDGGNTDEVLLFQPFLRSPSGADWGTTPPEMMLAIDRDTGMLRCLAQDDDLRRAFLAQPDKGLTPIMMLVSLVVRGLMVLNCSNVHCVDNPPPAALNKKRERSGKVPLFTYKTLHIKTQDRRTARGQPAGSERAGPRLHLRRGHIRRLDDARTTWVQSCVVGDKQRGIVMKDYRVTS